MIVAARGSAVVDDRLHILLRRLVGQSCIFQIAMIHRRNMSWTMG